MKVFSTHRRKLEPKRRFGTKDFQIRVKQAANYKRVFAMGRSSGYQKFFAMLGLKSKFWRSIAVIVLLVVLYFLFFSSKATVSKIDVSGNSQISTQQIQDTISNATDSKLFLIKKSNFFLMSESRIKKILVTNIPKIKDVTTERIWPDTVKIKITEHIPGFVIKSDNKYFLVDEDGIVVSQIEDPKNMLVVEDQLIEDFATGEVLHNNKLSAFVLSMRKQWPSKISTPISVVKFPGKESNEVQFVTSESWAVWFDTSRPVAEVLADLSVLLSKQIAAKDRPNLAYIDLRLNKWAYYCFKAAACSQQPKPNAAGATTDVKTQ